MSSCSDILDVFTRETRGRKVNSLFSHVMLSLSRSFRLTHHVRSHTHVSRCQCKVSAETSILVPCWQYPLVAFTMWSYAKADDSRSQNRPQRCELSFEVREAGSTDQPPHTLLRCSFTAYWGQFAELRRPRPAGVPTGRGKKCLGLSSLM